MSESLRLTLDEVHALVTETFLSNGGSPEQTRAVADTVTAAERDECKSQGLFRVLGYIESILSGKVNAIAEPKLERLAPGVIKVDGFSGFAPLALEVGCEPLVALAPERRCSHAPTLTGHPPRTLPIPKGEPSKPAQRTLRLSSRGR